MDIRKQIDGTTAEVDRRDPAEIARDGWLDRALEDSFPASDPLASHVFD